MMILGLTAPPGATGAPGAGGASAAKGAPFGGDPSQTKLSAEERLLQVIQNGGASPPKGAPFGPAGGGGFVQKIWSALKQGGASSGKKQAPGSGLTRLNRILGMVIAGGVALSVVNALYFKPDIGRIQDLVAGVKPPEPPPDIKTIPVEEFLAPITGRNLFQPKTTEPPLDLTAPPPAAPTVQSPVLDNLQLVGIAWGTEPEAMIREKTEGRTFFLKQGDELKGVVVKEILKDRVIVEFEGEIKEII